jgi:hypothetical protein
LSSTKDGISKPPKAELNSSTTQPPNFLQEKAQNAARLHAELNALIESQAQRQAKESSKPFGSSLKKFIKMNTKEFLNIFVAFMCVLLAWQITLMRKKARNLVDLSDEKEQIIKELRGILRQLSHQDEAFIDIVVERFVHEMKIYENSSDESLAENRWNYLKGMFWGANHRRIEDEENMRATLRLVVKQELDKVVGTATLSQDEMRQKKMFDLKSEMNISSSANLTSERDLVHLLNEANGEDNNSDESRIIKTRKGFI